MKPTPLTPPTKTTEVSQEFIDSFRARVDSLTIVQKRELFGLNLGCDEQSIYDNHTPGRLQGHLT